MDYTGPETLRGPVTAALQGVVDPELALSILDLGLVHGVCIADGLLSVTMTMTSPACPVADLIQGDVEAALDRVVPPDLRIRVDVVWEPAWTPDRLSARAKAFMAW